MWWPVVTAPWFLAGAVVLIGLYLWALIWSAQDQVPDRAYHTEQSLYQQRELERRVEVRLRSEKDKRYLSSLVSFWNLASDWQKLQAQDPPPLPNIKPQPDMPIWRAVEYVASVIGDTGEQECFPSTLIAIRQAAADGRISLWGKAELETKRGHNSEISTPIPLEYWLGHRLNSMASGPAWSHADHTWKEPYNPNEFQHRYYEVKANEYEIKKEWPNA